MNDLERMARTLGGEPAQKDLKKDYTECPECHKKYDWQTMANEPFRTIIDDDGKNKREVCEDCYFKWVGSDDDKVLSRYFTRIEETDEGICYVKNLHEDTRDRDTNKK